MYRCVKANGSDEVIAIGRDEEQAGRDYHGLGVWADFTFSELPEATAELIAAAKAKEEQTGKLPSVLKVSNGQIVLKEVGEV